MIVEDFTEIQRRRAELFSARTEFTERPQACPDSISAEKLLCHCRETEATECHCWG